MHAMATGVETYLQEPGGFRLRGVVGTLVVAAHLGLIAYAMMPSQPAEVESGEVMQAIFIAPPQREVPPPPHPKVEQPSILAAKRMSEPAPQAPVLPPEPIQEAPLEPPQESVVAPSAPVPPAMPVAAQMPANFTGVAVIYRPKPLKELVLPKELRTVTVKVRALVNVKGRAERISLEVSSGYAPADARALSDIRDYRFRPAMEGDVPVAKEVVLPIKYDARK